MLLTPERKGQRLNGPLPRLVIIWKFMKQKDLIAAMKQNIILLQNENAELKKEIARLLECKSKSKLANTIRIQQEYANRKEMIS